MMAQTDIYTSSQIESSSFQPSLCLLPPEVREMIYLLLPRYTTAPKPNAVYKPDYLVVPPLLLTNRQLYLEYLSHLCRHSTLLLPILISAKEFPITWTPQVILNEATKVRIVGLKYNWGFPQFPKPLRLNWRIKPMLQDCDLRLICTDVQDRMPRVDTLEMYIEILAQMDDWIWFAPDVLEDVLGTWFSLRKCVIVVTGDLQTYHRNHNIQYQPGNGGRSFEDVVTSVNEKRIEKGWQKVLLEVVGPLISCEHGNNDNERRWNNYPYILKRWAWEARDPCLDCFQKGIGFTEGIG